MAYKLIPNDQTTLMDSITRIERQLKLKGYEDKSSQRFNYHTVESENHKTIEDTRVKTSFYSSLYLNKQYEANSTNSNINGGDYPSSLKYSTDYEVRKTIENELNPYVATVKSDFKNTLNNFREEVKEFHRTQIDLKSYQDTLAANRINATRIENDTKLSIEKLTKENLDLDMEVKDLRDRFSEVNRKVVQATEDIKNNSERNAMISYLEQKVSDLDQRLNGSELYNTIEERIMSQVKSEMNQMKQSYDMRIDQLTNERNVLEQNNNSLIEQKAAQSSDNAVLKQSVIELTKRIGQLESNTHSNKAEIEEVNSMYKGIEDNMIQHKETIDAVSSKVNKMFKDNEQLLLHSSLNNPEQNNNDNNNNNEYVNEKDMREYVDSNVNLIKQTLKAEIDEVHSMIEQTNNQISTKSNNNNNNHIMPHLMAMTETSFNPEINDKVLTLSEQATTMQTQISNMKSDQIKLTTKLEEINNTSLSNHNIAITHNDTQFEKIKEEIAQLMFYFNQYKEEQVKLYQVYEKTFNSLITQVFGLQSDTKTLKQDQAAYEDNMETIQDNFEKIKPIMDGYPKIKSDFGLFTQIIQALTQNFEEIKTEVNSNFSSLSKWQNDLITNVTNAVNELKMDYNEKFRQSNAVISSSRIDLHGTGNKDDKTTAELVNKIDNLQLVSDRKYVAKMELDMIRSQIEEMDRKIKDNEVKKKSESVLIPQVNRNVIGDLTQAKENSNMNDQQNQPLQQQQTQQQQDKGKKEEVIDLFSKDQDWDF